MDPSIHDEHRARLARDGKLIRRADAACWKQGQECLAQAEQDAQAFLVKARESALAEEMRGYTIGLGHARSEMAQLILDAAVRRDAYLAAIETDLVGVVLNAVRKIFADFDDTERVRIVVAKALRTLRNQNQVTVRVHPSHRDALQSSVEMLIGASPNLKVLSVERDSRIRPGACSLSIEIGVFETDLETQIREIEHTLGRSISSTHRHEDPEKVPRQTCADFSGSLQDFNEQEK